jgi:hypothetical protein
MAADQTLQLPCVAFYHQEKPYLVNFRDQVTRVPKHKDTDASTFRDYRCLWGASCKSISNEPCNMYHVKISVSSATGPEACMMANPQSAEYLQSKAPFLADAV